MALKIFWTESAIEQLEKIFDFYKHRADIKIARNIIYKIIERTIQLENYPASGQIEELLKSRKKIFRYLVEDNYKIIYCLDKNSVSITAVFDTRQNPKKIKNI